MKRFVLPLCAFLLFACKDEPTTTEEAKKAQESAADALKHAMKAAEAAKKEATEATKEAGDKAPKDLGEAMKQMEKAMGAMASNVDPVSYKKLKALLPEKVGIYARTKTSGEKAAAMGMKVSHASGKYEGKDGATATVKITDAGTMKGMAAGMTAWALVEIERESDDGFERTFEHKGHPAHEKFQNKRQRGELHAFVSKRFVIEVTGRKADMKELKKLFEAIDISALEGMKDEGVKDDK